MYMKTKLINYLYTYSYPNASFMPVIIRKEASITHGKPRIKVCSICFFSICHYDLNALSNIRAGRNIARIPLGLSRLIIRNDYPTKYKFS